MSRAERDRELVRRLIAGDEAAFDEFADHYIPALHRFAMARLRGDRDLSRDIVQSTLVKAMAKLRGFRGDAALLTWLCACCRNEIAGHFRSRRKTDLEVELREELDAPSLVAVGPLSPEQALVRKEDAARVHEALDSLPPHYGKALEWKYIEALPVAEIAARLSLSPKAAESVLSRARAAFRDRYDGLARSWRESEAGSGVEATRLEARS